MLQELNDQVLFLGRNLSPEGIEMMQDDGAKMNDMVKEATTQVEALLSGAANVPAEDPADLPHPEGADAAADSGDEAAGDAAPAEDAPAEGDESS